MSLEEKVLNILEDLCEDEVVKEDLDVELFESGLMDSLAFTEMLVTFENELNVFIAPSEIGRSDLDTPRKIIEAVKNKTQH